MKVLIGRAERLLRWSERYLKTDMVYLAKGGFWLTLGQAVSTGMGLLLVVAFANLVPKEVYGNYKYVLSLASILAGFSLTGMTTAITQAVARGSEGVFRAGVAVMFKWSFIMVLAAMVTATYYYLNDNRAIAYSLLIAGALLPIIESTSLYGAYLNGKRDFRTATFYSIFRNLIPIATLLVTVFFTQDVVLLVTVYFLSHAVACTVLYLRVLKKYAPSQKADYSNTGYGKHVSLLNLLSIVASHLDKILIFHYLGAVQLAIYGIAFTIPAQMRNVTGTIGTLALPKLSSASLQTVRSAIYPKAAKMLLAFGVMITAYILIAPYVYKLAFPQYLEAVAISQGLALGYIFSPAILFSQTFFAQKRRKEMYIARIVTACTRVLLLLLLLPVFGIWGAVYAYFFTNAISLSTSLILFRRIRE